MALANKKVVQVKSKAQQHAQILKQVSSLLEKNLVKIDQGEVLLYQQIWKDRNSALNWMKCLHLYCILKRGLKPQDPLTFKNMETGEVIGTLNRKVAKLWIEF